MTYPIIQPPFSLKFREMSKSELMDYFAWFMNIMPGRIRLLEDAVNSTSSFHEWRADYTPTSLDALGEWYESEVAARDRTPEEVAEIRAKQMIDVPVEQIELTNRTFSLAMDIGMYLGEVMRRTCPGLRWDQYLKNKRDADYGQVTINGTDVVSMNTVGFLVGIAYSILRKNKTGRALRATYDIWSSPDSALYAVPLKRKPKKAAKSQ